MLHKLPVRAAFPLPFCLLRAAERLKLRRAQRACLFSSAGKQSAARQTAFLSAAALCDKTGPDIRSPFLILPIYKATASGSSGPSIPAMAAS